MLVKFLAYGTGSAQTAADYLHARDGQPGRCPGRRGDPDQVAAVGAGLNRIQQHIW